MTSIYASAQEILHRPWKEPVVLVRTPFVPDPVVAAAVIKITSEIASRSNIGGIEYRSTVNFDGPDSEIERLLNDYATACSEMAVTSHLWLEARKQSKVVDGKLIARDPGREMRKGALACANARSAVEVFIYNLAQKIES